MDFKSVYDDAIKESKNDLNTITGVVSLKVKKCNEFIAKSTDEDAKIFEVKAFVLDFDTDKKTKQTFIVVADTLDEAKEIVQDYSSTIESIVSVKETDILRII
ncbi:hypothetical protein [Porphyromonas cangingivalis]|uniref:hypothetical protein n=1 Tax=Porphyromonas cangingivalis TaxID=36874 RepID=UPI00242A40B5|nr:hypothetical protein [Porphyromonas cangingivalis]